MDILITGGTGTIGRALCAALLNQGHRLTILSRRPEKVQKLCGATVKAIPSLNDLSPSLNFDAVINLAGEPVIGPLWTKARRQKLLDSRVGITEQLISFLDRAQSKPKVLISASAVGWYGNGGDKLIDEISPGSGGFAHQLCEGWEQSARKAEAYGIRVCIVRIGLVLSDTGGLLVSMLPSFRLGLGAKLGNGQQWMPWVDYRDLIAIFLWLMEHDDLHGVFNGVAPNPVMNSQFTRALAKQLKRPAWLVTPGFLLKVILGEMGGLLLEGQKAEPKRILESGFQFQHEHLESSLAELLGHA